MNWQLRELTMHAFDARSDEMELAGKKRRGVVTWKQGVWHAKSTGSGSGHYRSPLASTTSASV